jgi:hypothetical protein
MTDLDVNTPSIRKLLIMSKGLFSGEPSSVGVRAFSSGLFKGCSGGGDIALVGGGNASAVVFEMPPPCRPPSRTFPPSPEPSGLTDPKRQLGSVLLVGILECAVLLGGW